MQVPDVIRVDQRVDLVTQGQVGVVNGQFDVAAFAGNGFLSGADITGTLDNGVDFFLRVATRFGCLGLVMAGFCQVHREVAYLRVQVIKHLER